MKTDKAWGSHPVVWPRAVAILHDTDSLLRILHDVVIPCTSVDVVNYRPWQDDPRPCLYWRPAPARRHPSPWRRPPHLSSHSSPHTYSDTRKMRQIKRILICIRKQCISLLIVRLGVKRRVMTEARLVIFVCWSLCLVTGTTTVTKQLTNWQRAGLYLIILSSQLFGR